MTYLDFGGLDLTGEKDYGNLRFVAQAAGSTLGNPEPVERSIDSALLDGGIVVTDSHNNREPKFQVWIYGADSAALAEGEKLLFQRCSRQTEFGLTPADGWGARTVYSAFTSSLEHQFDAAMEHQLVRAYELRLVCYPFGFSEDEITDVATDLVVAPSSFTISDGTSATGWTSPYGAVTSSGGRLNAPTFTDSVPSDLNLYADYRTHVASISMSLGGINFAATRYLTADMQMAGGYTLDPYAYVDEVQLRVISKVQLPNGMYRVTWVCDDPNAGTLRFTPGTTSSVEKGAAAPQVTLLVDNITRANTSTATGSTGRQSLRLVEVTGSARTMGSISVEHPTQGLGNDVLIYTARELADGYNPDVTPYLLGPQSTVVADSTNTVSGSWITAARKFNVVASSMPPGPHLILLRLAGTGVNGSISLAPTTVTVRSLLGSTVLAERVLRTVLVPTGGELPPAVYLIDTVTLPLTEFPAESEGIIQYEVDGGGTKLDSIWSFYMGEGADLTWVKAGTGAPAVGTSHNRLFMDAPNLTNGGAAGLYLGTAADRTDAYHPAGLKIVSWGEHPLSPPNTLLFIVTTAATYALVKIRHRPAWFTFAGRKKKK